MFGQYGGKPRSKGFLRCRKRVSLSEPAPPGIQFSTDILDSTTLLWLIYEIVQCTKKCVESYNLVPMLWREKARSKMKSPSVGCQEPLIRSARNSRQLLRSHYPFASFIYVFCDASILAEVLCLCNLGAIFSGIYSCCHEMVSFQDILLCLLRFATVFRYAVN